MWKYQDLLNQNIQILLEIIAGAAAVVIGPISFREDFRSYNKLLFNVIFPAAISTALGINTDLRQGNIWKFVAAWIMMRGILLVVVTLVVGLGMRRNVGEVTVNWLCATWVSTVVLGIPLTQAALGASYANLGAVAAISSYIFQLPVSLVLLEMNGGRVGSHPQEREEALVAGLVSSRPEPIRSTGQTIIASENGATSEPKEEEGGIGNQGTPMGSELPRAVISNQREGQKWIIPLSSWKYVAEKVFKNIIMISIVLSIIVSVSTLGPKYLNPGNPPLQPNCSYIPGLGFVYMFLRQLAACTEPIALFATGMFLVYNRPSWKTMYRATLYMITKFILVPMLMIGCAFAVGLEGGTARAAVLISALPIAPAAVSLATIYGVRKDVIVENIFFGNLLVMPSTLGWMAVMDAIDLFPVNAPPVIDVCANSTR